MIPLSIGTQTGGSVIRPASFCGIVGYKPTFGTVSTEGVKRYAGTLDTVGWYARSVEDAALLAGVFEVSDNRLDNSAKADALRIGFCNTPYSTAAEPDTRLALAEARLRLTNAGATVVDVELDKKYANLDDCRRTIMRAEGRINFLDLHRTHPDKISAGIRQTMTRVEDRAVRSALDHAAVLRPAFDDLAHTVDAIITPSAPGEALTGLESTGDSIFNGLWTLLHVPCINIPGLNGARGAPVGIQLVAARYDDARLLATARIVENLLRS
jgi:Asp-tRNA(Asn)/Glu-tRNA(Gln) amidotransferase A subunit family amidase